MIGVLAVALAAVAGALLAARAALALHVEAVDRALLRLQAADEVRVPRERRLSPTTLTRAEKRSMIAAHSARTGCTPRQAAIELNALYGLLDCRAGEHPQLDALDAPAHRREES